MPDTLHYRHSEPREIRRAVVEALSKYIETFGEISDDPDDVNSAAAAVWIAIGADKCESGTCAMCERVNREYQAATGLCSARPGCWRPSISYFYPREGWSEVYGTCATHLPSVEGEGFTVRKIPGRPVVGS